MRHAFIGAFLGVITAGSLIASCGGGGGPSGGASTADLELRVGALETGLAGLTTTVNGLGVDLGSLGSALDLAKADILALQSTITALQGTVDVLAAAKPTSLFKHVSAEYDGLTLPSNIANGVVSNTATHIKQVTYTPRNPHDIPLAYSVKGDLEITTANRALYVQVIIKSSGGSTTFDSGAATGGLSTGSHSLALELVRSSSPDWYIDPPTSYTITLMVHEGASDLDATLDNLKFTIWTLEGETITVDGSSAFS